MLTGRCRRADDASIRNPNVGPPSCRSSIGSSRRPVDVRNGSIVVEPDQPGLLELSEARVVGQHLPMPLVAVERRRRGGPARRTPPCRRDRRACASGRPPRSATSSHRRSRAARRSLVGPMPTSISSPAPSAANQRRITSRSAGEHRELNGHGDGTSTSNQSAWSVITGCALVRDQRSRVTRGTASRIDQSYGPVAGCDLMSRWPGASFDKRPVAYHICLHQFRMKQCGFEQDDAAPIAVPRPSAARIRQKIDGNTLPTRLPVV